MVAPKAPGRIINYTGSCNLYSVNNVIKIIRFIIKLFRFSINNFLIWVVRVQLQWFINLRVVEIATRRAMPVENGTNRVK